MKKILLMILAGTMFMFTGCSIFSSEFDYQSFASLVGNPTTLAPGFSDGDNVEFAAYIASETFKALEDSDDDYVIAYISRSDSPLVINVSDLDKAPKNGEFIMVDGEIDGYIYSTSEGQKQETLSVKAKSFEKLELDDSKAEKTGTCKNINEVGSIEFLEAQQISPLIDNGDGSYDIALYYEYEVITGNAVTMPGISEFFIFQGEERLTSTYTTKDDELKSEAVSSSEKLSPGEKVLVYATYKGIPGGDNKLTIERFDDEFNLACEIEVDINPKQ